MAGQVLAIFVGVGDEILEPQHQTVLFQFVTRVFDQDALARGYRRDGEVKIAIDERKKQVSVVGQVIRNEQLSSNPEQFGQLLSNP